MHLERGAPLSLTLPPQQVSVLDIQALETHPPDFDKPDLAVSLDTVDVVFNRHLIVNVHNIGAAPAESVQVRVRDAASGKIIPTGEQVIERIEAPTDFEPRSAMLQLDNVYATARGMIVEVDPENEIDELNPYNNRVVLDDGHVLGPKPVGAERKTRRTGKPNPHIYGGDVRP